MAVDACFNPRAIQHLETDTALLRSAFETGLVSRVLAVGSCPASTRTAAALHSAFGDKVPFAAGIHPNNASTHFTESNKKDVEMHISDGGAVAVGECGIDFWSTRANSREAHAQVECFKWHISLAVKYCKPMLLHIRNSRQPRGHERTAVDTALELLDDAAADLHGIPLFVHCFTGTPEDAAKYVSRGFYVGVTAFVGFPESYADGAREAVRSVIPLHQLILETDAPHMAPRTLPSASVKRRHSTPSDVICVAEIVAQLLGVKYDELISSTTENFNRMLTVSPETRPCAWIARAVGCRSEEEQTHQYISCEALNLYLYRNPQLLARVKYGDFVVCADSCGYRTEGVFVMSKQRLLVDLDHSSYDDYGCLPLEFADMPIGYQLSIFDRLRSLDGSTVEHPPYWHNDACPVDLLRATHIAGSVMDVGGVVADIMEGPTSTRAYIVYESILSSEEQKELDLSEPCPHWLLRMCCGPSRPPKVFAVCVNSWFLDKCDDFDNEEPLVCTLCSLNRMLRDQLYALHGLQRGDLFWDVGSGRIFAVGYGHNEVLDMNYFAATPDDDGLFDRRLVDEPGHLDVSKLVPVSDVKHDLDTLQSMLRWPNVEENPLYWQHPRLFEDMLFNGSSNDAGMLLRMAIKLSSPRLLRLAIRMLGRQVPAWAREQAAYSSPFIAFYLSTVNQLECSSGILELQ